MRGGTFLLFVLALVGCGATSGHAPQSAFGGDAVGIVGGTEVTAPNAYSKHVVFIQIKMDQGGAACTGSILDSQTILTAAHCVSGASGAAVAFTTNVNGGKVDPKFIRQIDGVVIHSKFRPEEEESDEGDAAAARQAVIPGPNDIPTVEEVQQALDKEGDVDYDIALLHFSGGLPAGFSPVQLATSAAIVKPGAALHMIGFGLAEVDARQRKVDGQVVTVPVPNQATVGQLRETEVPVSAVDTNVGMILTNTTKSGVCNGDSGGPGFMSDSKTGNIVQVGIAEAVATQYCNSVSMHTSIFPFLTWIKQNAAKLAEQAGKAGA